MNILVVSNCYPSKNNPGFGAFVYNLIQGFSVNHNITVIAPKKAHDVFKMNVVKSYGNESCTILRPIYLSFSSKDALGFNTIVLTNFFLKKAIRKTLKQLELKPDIIYCHFLDSAVPVLDYAHQNNIPIIIASGESTYSGWEIFSSTVKDKLKRQTEHIVCVSESNKSRLIDLGFDEIKMTVIPNAVDYSLFQPMNKTVCKQKLGFNKDDFVVGFVGHFIERKGPNRVIQAIEKLQDKNIKLVCVGKGGALQKNDFTLEFPPVPNQKLPEIFNAFDVFVLPTLHEGHCNAIEEAKACGIPIISSKGTSVEKQLTEDEGVLIDPKDIDGIADAIAKLKSDKKLLSFYAKRLVEGKNSYDIQKRAEMILLLIKKVVR